MAFRNHVLVILMQINNAILQKPLLQFYQLINKTLPNTNQC